MKNINCLIVILSAVLLLFACHKRLDDDIFKPKIDTGTYYRTNNVMSGHISNLNSLSVKKFGHVWGEYANVSLENAMNNTSFENEYRYEESLEGGIDTFFLFDLESDRRFQSYLGNLEPYKEYYINIYFIDVNDERNYGIEQIIYTCE